MCSIANTRLDYNMFACLRDKLILFNRKVLQSLDLCWFQSGIMNISIALVDIDVRYCNHKAG